MLKDRTLLCISCIICPTIYVQKHLSRLTYRRAPAKGNNPVVTRNRRIGSLFVILKRFRLCRQESINKQQTEKNQDLPLDRLLKLSSCKHCVK